jgi:hypothetical protein
MTDERSCTSCKHYPIVLGTPTINDWSKRCWDCVGVSNFAKIHLALYEPRDYDLKSDFLEKLKSVGKE